jgi:hypothetical protein
VSHTAYEKTSRKSVAEKPTKQAIFDTQSGVLKIG